MKTSIEPSIVKLIELRKENMQLTNPQIEGALLKARFDYLFKFNANVKQLIEDLGKDRAANYVDAIARCWLTPSNENRNKVLDLAKDLVPVNLKPFSAATYRALAGLVEKPIADKKSYVALTQIMKCHILGQDHNAVQLEP